MNVNVYTLAQYYRVSAFVQPSSRFPFNVRLCLFLLPSICLCMDIFVSIYDCHFQIPLKKIRRQNTAPRIGFAYTLSPPFQGQHILPAPEKTKHTCIMRREAEMEQSTSSGQTISVRYRSTHPQQTLEKLHTRGNAMGSRRINQGKC